MRSTFVSMTLGLALLATLERGAAAGTILVFGDHVARAEAQDRLNEAGHFVTIYGALPADISNYDAVWHVGVATEFDDATRNQLAEFMKLGGGVFLSGEWDCCQTMNASVQQVVNRLVKSAASAPTAIRIGGLGTATAGTQYFNEGAIADITSAPNELVEWRPGTTGRMSGVEDENVLTRDEEGFATGAAWGASELVSGGQLVVVMDTDWYNRPGAAETAENLAKILIEGAPEPVRGNKPPVESRGEMSSRGGITIGAIPHEIADEESEDELEVGGCSAGGGAGGGLGLLGILGALAFVNRKRR